MADLQHDKSSAPEIHGSGSGSDSPPASFGKPGDVESGEEKNRRASVTSDVDPYDSSQHGVRRQEAVAQTWSRKGLYLGYLGIALLATATSLEGQTTYLLQLNATSALGNNLGLMSTISTIQNILLAVLKPPMAKISNVFGRLEAFCFSVFLYVIGYIMQAGSNNIRTFAASQIFYSAGSTGLSLLIQIFVADTSDLLNRALVSSLPDVPYLFTAFAGPEIGEIMQNNWRWGYGLWAIVLVACFVPIGVTLLYYQIKASRLGVMPPSPYKGQSVGRVAKSIFFEMDTFGLLLVCAAFSLLLIPLTLAAGADNGWQNPSIIAMLVVGGICFIAIPFWETNRKLAPYAFFPPDLFKSRTVLGGLGIGLFYFMAFYLSVFPYYTTYLQVVHNMSVSASGYVTQTFTFASTVTSIVIAFAIKYTKHYKWWVTLGCCIYTLGMGLMLAYRTSGASTGTLIGVQIAVGIGGGMLNVPAQVGVQAAVNTHGEVSAVTAVFLTVIQLGGAIGSAISGAIWTDRVPTLLLRYLPAEEQGNAMDIYGDISVAKAAYPMGTPERDAVNRAYQEAMTTLLIVAVCATVPCIFFSLMMKNYKLDQVHQHVKGNVIGGINDDEREPVARQQSSAGFTPAAEMHSSQGLRGKLMQRFKASR